MTELKRTDWRGGMKVEFDAVPNLESVVDVLKGIFDWGSKKAKQGNKVHVHAISGTVNPLIWNRLGNELTRLLEAGASYRHMFGPILETEEGKHVLLDAVGNRSFDVEYSITPVRFNSNWVAVHYGNKNNEIRYKARIDDLLLPEISGGFFASQISLIDDRDSVDQRLQKEGLLYSLLEQFKVMQYGTFSAKSPLLVPVIDRTKLAKVYDSDVFRRECGVLTAKEIQEVAASLSN